MRPKIVFRFLFLSLVAGWTGVFSCEAALKIGAARTDITPDYPIRLSGYGGRTANADGVEQRLYASALAIGDQKSGSLSVVMAVENTGVPQWMTEDVFKKLESKLKLRREQFAVTSSHSHTAPMLKGVLPNLFSKDLTPEEEQTIDRYSTELVEKMVATAVKAAENQIEAELWWGQGRASFAKNRRTQGGPVDHDLPLLASRGSDGKWKALWVNYACHCTTLGGDFNKHCGDWAGYAREYLEEKYPGAVTLVSIGCGADSDPFPRTGLDLAKKHGREIADEVDQLLGGNLKKIDSTPTGHLKYFDLSFDRLPTRQEWEARAKNAGIVGYHARKNLKRLDNGEALQQDLPYSVQSWIFGKDLAMVFLPGEVVVDYSLRIKREYDRARVWVNAYANDVPCYIPSERIWLEGGYEGGGAMLYYDRPTRLARDTEARVFAKLGEVLPKVFADDKAAEFPPAKTPEEALNSFRTKPGLEIELVASEPLVVDPVAIDFAADGKLWVAEMHDYPMGMDGKYKPGGRIQVLDDRDGDGRFDYGRRLANDLPFPTGVLAWGKGALVCAAPDILYIEDSDGDGKADIRKPLFSGFAVHNFQARVNSLRWGLDGWVYGAAGLFGGTIHSHLTGKDHLLSGRDFRIKPASGEFEQVSGISQQGRVRDDFGNWFGCDNGAWMWHFPYSEHYLSRNPHLSVTDTRVYVANEPNSNHIFPISRTLERFNDLNHVNRTTSACGLEVYRDQLLGKGFYHNGFICEPVHNVVHRLVVSPDGTTFRGVRAEEEKRSEFLASSDNWFRPVEARTGPDGALWIVDMYRFVVEHPIWISADRLAKLDVRAGASHGRIYRVKPKGFNRPAAWENLTRKTTKELVDVLRGSNGVLRDLAHRLLLEKNDPATASHLKQAIGSKITDGAMVQCLFLLNQLGGVDERTLLSALENPSAPVRKAAIELAEKKSDSKAIADKLSAMVSDPDPQVRLQLAFSLGEVKSEAAGTALGKLAIENLNDHRMQVAVLSSSSRFAPQILDALLLSSDGLKGKEPILKQLVLGSDLSNQAKTRANLVGAILPKNKEPLQSWQLEVLASLQEGKAITDPELSKALQNISAQSFEIARNDKEPIGIRKTAVSFLAHAPEGPSKLKNIIEFLEPSYPSELQHAALAALRQFRGSDTAELLLQDFHSRTKAMQAAILDELLNREEWTLQLLEAIEKGMLSVGQLTAANRQRLQDHPSQKVVSKAAALLKAGENLDRQALVQSYSDVANLTGDPVRGLSLFQNACASCHRVRAIGYSVGPDLTIYQQKPVGDFLLAVLHPNAVVEPRFINYQIETKDERSLSGLVQDETANSITLAQPGGMKETLLRKEIISIKPSRLSLMPEGLESILDKQGMADLLAYLKTPYPRPFGSGQIDETEKARKEFLESNSRAVQKIVSSSEKLEYASWIGHVTLHLCRQKDGKQSVEWESAPLAHPPGKDQWVEFRIPIGMGYISQPSGHFSLHLNGTKALEFNVSRFDAFWEGNDLPVRTAYLVKETNPEDSNGILLVEVKGSLLRKGEPIRWKVQGSAKGSERWFGIYWPTKSSPTALLNTVEEIAAAILDDSRSQAEREQLIAHQSSTSAQLIQEMARGLGNDTREEYRRIPWIWRVAIAAGKRNNAKEIEAILEVSLPSSDPLKDWQAVVIGGGIINGISLLQVWPRERIESILSSNPSLLQRWKSALEKSIGMAQNSAVPTGTRYDALRMAALLPWETSRPILLPYLNKEANSELQQGSVSGLVDVNEPAAADALLNSLDDLSSYNRDLALKGLLRGEERRQKLRQALASRQINAENLQPELRAELDVKP